jgi:hypothetical protein
MQNSYIEEHDIARQYLIGKLSTEDQRVFEEHLMDCRECLDRLDEFEGLRDGLRRARKLSAVPSHAVGARRWAPAIAAGVAFVLAAVPGYLAWQELRSARVQVARQDLRLAELEQRLGEAQARALGVSGAALYRFEQVRGGAAPVNRVLLPAAPQPIVLLIPLVAEPGATGYRLRILGAAGRPALTLDTATLDSSGRLVVVFSSSLLQPGDGRLVIDAKDAAGGFSEIASYGFQAAAVP